jgi:hypothetical protein
MPMAELRTSTSLVQEEPQPVPVKAGPQQDDPFASGTDVLKPSSLSDNFKRYVAARESSTSMQTNVTSSSDAVLHDEIRWAEPVREKRIQKEPIIEKPHDGPKDVGFKNPMAPQAERVLRLFQGTIVNK